MCGCPDLVVMGWDSKSKGRGFESQHCTQDGSFFKFICCNNCTVVWKDRTLINKRPRMAYFLKKNWEPFCLVLKKLKVRQRSSHLESCLSKKSNFRPPKKELVNCSLNKLLILWWRNHFAQCWTNAKCSYCHLQMINRVHLDVQIAVGLAYQWRLIIQFTNCQPKMVPLNQRWKHDELTSDFVVVGSLAPLAPNSDNLKHTYLCCG